MNTKVSQRLLASAGYILVAQICRSAIVYKGSNTTYHFFWLN